MEQMSAAIRIGKETFAAGLFWQPAPTAMMAAREARIVAAKAELAADLFCVRKRGVPQFGLGQRKVGHKVGMRAIAPVLASSILESSWIGVFSANSGWLYVMVRKGAVMPDGDLLFMTEQEARQRLRSEMSIGDWDVVFAPAHWQLEGSRSDDLVDLISTQSDARMRSVARKPWVSLTAFCVAVAAGVGMWVTLFPPMPETPSVPNVPVAPPPPPPPWQGQPAIRALILACEHAIEGSQSLPGFEIEGAFCGPTGSSATYRRRWGSIAWLPKNIIVASPDRVTMAAPLPSPLVRRAGGERPPTLDSIRRLIWGAAQTYRLDCELTEIGSPGSNLLPSRGAPDAGASPFHAITLALGGRLPPSVLSGLLDGIPTFVVEEISWQSTGWRVRGKAYVR